MGVQRSIYPSKRKLQKLALDPFHAYEETTGGEKRSLGLCGVLLVAQVLALIMICQALAASSFRGRGDSQDPQLLSLKKLKDVNNYAHDPRVTQTYLLLMRVWFFEHVYEHPRPKLIALESLEIDGAAPILSNIPQRPKDITLVTQTSPDRLTVVEKTAATWTGELVAVIYIDRSVRNETYHLYRRVWDLHTRIEALGLCRLNIYFAVDDEDGLQLDDFQGSAYELYPVNALRNLAIDKTNTELVLLLDADFLPSPGLHESLTGSDEMYEEIHRRTTEQRQLLVVPAFEAIQNSDSRSEATELEIPKNKLEVLQGWRDGSIDCFHCSRCPCCHKPTDHIRYFDSATKSLYRIIYRESFEPYFVAAKAVIPKYDDRFRGYGKNKQQHAYHCTSLGFDWWVLPKTFVFAIPHPPSEAWKIWDRQETLQRVRVMGLYKRFKKEVQQATLTAPLASRHVEPVRQCHMRKNTSLRVLEK
ncbi:hypothetical protein R1sor_006613 [Riccia sorocarpa]|uniref:Uncharacterized protein n=1 Tax=Riccia sorocarpa TaxID=122646 RepID=A0ABD3HQY0_9MARC